MQGPNSQRDRSRCSKPIGPGETRSSIAISNRRLLSADENGVTFKHKDYRIEGPARYKTMTLPTNEFIRRFLIHVLPKGFHRIRHYGCSPTATGKHCARAPAARPARAPKRTRDARSCAQTTPRAAASMPVLRQPHDHHRDFRARLREVPAHAACGKSGSTPHDAVAIDLHL
jgi:hypothetical protein